jgi:hypothetical protein
VVFLLFYNNRPPVSGKGTQGSAGLQYRRGSGPGGNYGEGVYAVFNWLAETGHRRVITKLYSGRRHEIHNDRDIREEVADGIIAFLNGVL